MSGNQPYHGIARKSWHELLEFHRDLMKREQQWVFRGQSNSAWPLKATLRRKLDELGVIDRRDAVRLEGGLLRRFKRQCQHYMINLPSDDDFLEWLSLMRHYFVPSRLLDFTYSFFIAVYFALEEKTDTCDCALWALNTSWMKTRFEHVLPSRLQRYFKTDENMQKPKTFRNLFLREEPLKMVLALNPYRLNERLVAQQGIFLCQGDMSVSFDENLAPLLSGDESQDTYIKCTIQVTREARSGILRELHRMNINRATLFPDLQGFADSLSMLLITFPDTLIPDKNWPAGS